MNFAVYELRPVEISFRKLNEGIKVLTVASFFCNSNACLDGEHFKQTVNLFWAGFLILSDFLICFSVEILIKCFVLRDPVRKTFFLD